MSVCSSCMVHMYTHTVLLSHSHTHTHTHTHTHSHTHTHTHSHTHTHTHTLTHTHTHTHTHTLSQIGDLYSTDVNNLQLSLEFWSPVEAVQQPGLHYRHVSVLLSCFFSLKHRLRLCYFQTFRAPQRQLSLFKFISTCSDLLPAPLFTPFMHMLTGLSDSPPAAHYSFNFLKANSPSLGIQVIVCIFTTCTHTNTRMHA